MSSAVRPVQPTARRWLRRGGVLLGLCWLLLPLLPLVLWSAADRWAFPSVLPTSWGLRGWREGHAQGAGAALLRSAALGVVVAALATPAGAAAGRALAGRRLPAERMLTVALLVPVALPPFAVVMGLSTVALQLRVPAPVAVVVVLTVAALPYTTFVMRSAYASYDGGYEDEARTLGATSRTVLVRVQLPLVAPALAASAFLAFLVAWSDYIVTLLLGGGSLVTLPMLVGALSSASGNDASVAAVSVAAVAPPLALLVAVGALARSRATR